MMEWAKDIWSTLWNGSCWHLWHKENGLIHEVGKKFVGASYDRRCLKCGEVRHNYWMPL